MLDIKIFRETPELIKENLKKLGKKELLKTVDEIIALDKEFREIKLEADSLRNKRNEVSCQINILKKQGKSTNKLLTDAKKIPQKIELAEKKQEKAVSKINALMFSIPNTIHKEVPAGKNSDDNKEIKKWGKPKKFDFEPKNHVEICEKNKWADFEASAKISGSGFYFIKNDLALLNQALIRFSLDFMSKKGYLYIEPPLMIKRKIIDAAMGGSSKEFENSIYVISGEDLNLIGTSEHAILGLHENELISEDELPKKYFSYSMCFRKEVGSHGINEKGLWRTHQFNKIEQFTFCKPEESEKLYDELLKNSEEIMQNLELPYRVVEMCTGDLANWKHRSHDIEVWRPTTKNYGEIASLSNCTDYQARDLNIRVKYRNGEKKVVHTLNNTAIATSRVLVAILENFQNKDGTITIPKVLVSYMNGKTKI